MLICHVNSLSLLSDREHDSFQVIPFYGGVLVHGRDIVLAIEQAHEVVVGLLDMVPPAIGWQKPLRVVFIKCQLALD